VGRYLRETRRTNKDGSVVRYLQLAHNTRHPDTGVSTASVIHNFGRAENVDRDALARLVSSISRFLDPADAVAAAAGAEVDILDSRHLGGAWALDQLWGRLGVAAALHRAAAGRRLDAEAAERVIFALVAQRALDPGSKLACCRWVAERVAIDRLAGLDTDAAYAGMDFLLAALEEIAAEVFSSVAHLLNLDLDIVFVDTTSTYWEVDGADQLADLAEDPEAGAEDAPSAESATRTWGNSKDHRPDLPQVIIAMAVTRDGIPVRCWTFPGNTGDQPIIRRIKDDLGAWNLRRLVWVADRGFASATNRAYLTRGGGHYIHITSITEICARTLSHGHGQMRPPRYFCAVRGLIARCRAGPMAQTCSASSSPAGRRAAAQRPRPLDRDSRAIGEVTLASPAAKSSRITSPVSILRG
jgi:hypothetical protein